MEYLRICRIEKRGDRLLLHGENHPDYFVIADSHIQLGVGMDIVYEPDGLNFGWFVGFVDERCLG